MRMFRMASYDLLVKIIRMLMSFISSILIARYLGPQNQGIYAFVLLITILLSGHLHLGVHNSTLHFMKEYRPKIILSTVTFFIVLLSLGYVAILVLLKQIGYIEFDGTYVIFIFIGFYVVSLGLNTVISNYFISNDKLNFLNTFSLLIGIFEFITIVILYSYGLLTINNVLLTKSLYIILFAIYVFVKEFKLTEVSFKWNIILSMIKFGLFIYISNFLNFLSYRIDQFLINFYYGDAMLGIYSIPVRISDMAIVVFASISTIALANLLNSSNISAYLKLFKANYLLMAVILLALYVFSYLLPIFYGEDYIMSASILRIYSFTIIGSGFGKITTTYLFVYKKFKEILIATSVALIFNLLLNLILLPEYGVEIAAYISIISYGLFGLISLLFFMRHSKITFRLLLITREDIKATIRLISKEDKYHEKDN